VKLVEKGEGRRRKIQTDPLLAARQLSLYATYGRIAYSDKAVVMSLYVAPRKLPILFLNWPISADFYPFASFRVSEMILVSRLLRWSSRLRSGPWERVRRNISITC